MCGADLMIMKLPRGEQITGFKTDINAGYFRDSYNDSNLLWKYGLSYWVDIPKYQIKKKGQLLPNETKTLLTTLDEKQAKFKKAIKPLAKDEREYFEAKDKEFKKFLNLAIKLDSPIECSC
jgi:hypothetical protein